MKKNNIKKNDMVLVLSGESKGSKGKVIKVYPNTTRVIVEGVNLVSRHTKPNANAQEGGIIKKEAPIHMSNVMLIDPKSGEPTRIYVQKNKEGRKIRISKKTGEEIK
ncbi:MAG: 50S ribosomal protein L24 [Bacteroidota bacterium]|nr:50S ribosomal protein L24 [Bacteroidota bacterium]